MAGLLGNGWDDPQSSAIMALAGGLLQGNFGGGLLGANNAYADAKRAQVQDQMRQMQMRRAGLEMEGLERENLLGRQMDEAARSSFITPQRANAMSMGPMPDGSNMPTIQPGFNQPAFLQKLYSINPLKAMEVERSMAKDNSPLTVAPGASLVDRHTFKPVFTAPKEPDLPSAVREYEFAKGQGYKGTFEQWDTARRRAGATTVNVDNLGLKPKDRFEMEDKLRADYSKATGEDQAIITTAADIKNILAQPGSLKDQAAIYKFAKALDPQGAVREADYAAIVKTAGGLEYLQNLANKALTGEQLSPGQRKQMADVTAAMARVAQQRIARQQQTYSGRAKMYNLTPENVFTPSGKSDEWAILPSGGR